MSFMPSTTSEKIVLNFAWTGPNTWCGGCSGGGLSVGVVDLIFKDAKTNISVSLPENINPTTPKKLSFRCRKPLGETRPDSLGVTTEQVRNLTLKAGVFEKGRPIGPRVMDSSGKITQQETVTRSDRAIDLEIPQEFESGKTYSLVVSSDDLSLSARLVKEEAARSVNEEEKAPKTEMQEQMVKMGEALMAEGMKNLNLAASGAFDTYSSAEVFAHVMRGTLGAAQQINPEIKVPYTRPSESASDLDKLSAAALQSGFKATLMQDREFESQRMRAMLAGNMPEMNRIIAAEMANSQLLMNLGEALERKGIEPKIS